MSPLPGWKVIPDGWAERHQPTAESTMTSPAIFLRISDGPAPYPMPEGWTGSRAIWGTPEDPILVRVQELKREASPVPTNQPTVERQYQISTPLGGPELRSGERGDVVSVLGRQYRIISRMTGSLLWEQDLICVDNLTQQNPG